MAERTVRQLIDDIDGSEITDGQGGRVEFAFRGSAYAIDLTAHNMAKFEKAVAPYIASAAKVSGARGRSRAARNGATSHHTPKRQLSIIREWANENGYEVSSRGRIKAEIVEAFEAAH